MSVPTPFHRLLADARPRTILQPDAARAAGVSRGTLSLWERGQLVPSVAEVVALWELYGTPEPARADMLAAVRDAAAGRP